MSVKTDADKQMADERYLNILRKGVSVWNQWRAERPDKTESSDIEIDLSRINLKEADLRGVNFTNVNLVKAKLRRANLSQANLSYSNLMDARLNRANLEEADLYGSQLTSADLNKGILVGTDLRRTNLRVANMSDADLCGANLTGADLNGADFSRANLSRSILSGCNVTGILLNNANLKKAHLSGISFRSSFLNDVDFMGATLSDVNFGDAVIQNSRFGNNVGLTQSAQVSLERRGAIIEFTRSPNVKNYKHFLLLGNKPDERLIHLRAMRYSIGRDTKASIILSDHSVSRFHAMLHRLSNFDHTTSYYLTDGDLGGKRSTNGILINGKVCRTKILESGDLISVGNRELQYFTEEETLSQESQKSLSMIV